MKRRLKGHAAILIAATATALFTIPAGNAVKDYGLIHAAGLVLLLFVITDLYWIAFGE